MVPIRVLIVDDHHIVRQGLHLVLDPDPHFVIVGETGDGDEAIRLATHLKPQVVLLDLKLPDTDGVSVCQRILQTSPETLVIILTAFIDPNLVNACLQAGARGYLVKDAEDLRLREQIRAVVEGHAALDPRAAGILTDLVQHRSVSGDALRLRDLEILRLIAQGLTNREVGEQLHLSENTIKGYVKEILAKLGAHSRVEAVMLAKKQGLL